MFGKPITLFRLFGFDVRIDLSWIVIAALITWSLATGFFPQYEKGLSHRTYWLMGIAGAVALFVSIIAHEMSHSLVARRFGLPMKGITLFIFGGVAEMSDEPPSPRAELLMAIAGPAMSLAIAIAFWALHLLGKAAEWRIEAVSVFAYLASVNAALLLFNLIPAFPLDGGRVLRSILWMRSRNLRAATRTASRIGSLFGAGLILLGVVSFFIGNFIGGLWWLLIGMFLRNAAAGSYQQVLVRQALEGEPVRKFMVADPVTVPRSISVKDLVDDYIYKHHFKLYPVVDGERLLGCITTRDVKNLPREEWERQTVGALTQECSPRNTVGPDMDAMKALAKMNSTATSRLMVVDGGRLLGVLTLKDLLKFLSIKVELEE